jgi:hypothetical protein
MKVQQMYNQLDRFSVMRVVAKDVGREVDWLRAAHPRPYSHRAQGHRRRVVHGVLTPLDPSLTLTHTQHPAMMGKAEKKKRVNFAGFASPCNLQQPSTAHS